MNEITLNIDDYIDEDEKRELCRKAFLCAAEQKGKADLERIISNAAFAVVFEAVDKAMDGNAISSIKNKVIERIGQLGNYEIFRKADAWDKSRGTGDSEGQKAIEEAVKANTSVIHDRVKEIFQRLDAEQLSSWVKELVYEVISDRIIGKKEAA